MLFTTGLTLLAAAVTSVSAVPAPKCGSGAQAGSVFQEAAFPKPPCDLLKIVGQFQVSDWQGLPQVNQSGPDNTPGSTRTVALGDLRLIEEIRKYKKQPNKERTETIFFLNNGPTSLAGQTITQYQETFVTVPLCGGRASQIQWGVQYCYSQGDNATVGGLFTGAHNGGFANVEAALGSFNGDCATLA